MMNRKKIWIRTNKFTSREECIKFIADSIKNKTIISFDRKRNSKVIVVDKIVSFEVV